MLVLSVKEGQDFFIGDERFVLDKILGIGRFRLSHKQQHKLGSNVVVCKAGTSFTITDEHATEILDEVFVSAGSPHTMGTARVAIEAPSEILVLRGDKKRNPPQHLREAACL
jgi:sRNA-binding carbon storage regulator CsrA